MLRVSSQITGTGVDVAVVDGAGDADSGIEHGAALLAFTDAVMRGESAIAERARLRAALSPEGFIDVAALIGSFNVVDRIADATGIPLDPEMTAMSGEVRDRLKLSRFASAANTPGT
jgi:hypothetical protein